VSSGVCWWVTCSYELDSFEGDPLLVRGSPETVLLSDLSEESDNSLGSVLVNIWKVDLITEHN
jgi:hypothetical protein